MRVFLYGNGRKAGVNEAAERLEKMLAASGSGVLVGKDLEFSKDLGGVEADVILALGGDGTVLYLARHLYGRQIPVLSVNVGRLGFLAEVQIADVPAVLGALAAGQAHVSRRMMLWCEVHTEPGERKAFFRALNDAVVSREGGRMLAFEISCSSGLVMSYPGDGVIVSTPTGSTAYGLSAGGPILDAELEALALVPICPHMLSTRPVVFAGTESVHVRLAGHGDKARFTADGQEGVELLNGDTLAVTRAAEPFLLVSTGKSRFETIREKLDWNRGYRG